MTVLLRTKETLANSGTILLVGYCSLMTQAEFEICVSLKGRFGSFIGFYHLQ